MNPQKLVLFIFLYVSFFKLQSQIVVSPSVGCTPAGITNANFTYLGPPAANLLWNFGDASGTSTITSPQHSYLNAGSYVVTCVANSITYSYTVTVYPPPASGIGNFVIPQNHCSPMVVPFSGSSTSPNVVFNWDFGDNNSAQGAVLTHTYYSAGIFTPILSITNTITGCFLNISYTSTPVNVSLPPTLSITSSNGYNSCSAPFSTVFNANGSLAHSPLPGTQLSYAWNFGNSQTGSGVGPHTANYNSQNIYTVSLTATDNNNCSNTKTVNVTVVMPTVSFTLPTAVCIDAQVPPFPLLNSQMYNSVNKYFSASVVSSQTSTVWDMGDGSSPFIFPYQIAPPGQPTALTPNAVFTNSVYLYSSAGVKTVTVKAFSGTCPPAIATRTIFVEQVVPSFTSSPPYFTCNPTLAVTYNNQSTVNSTPGLPISTLSYTWNVSHWDQDPLHSYTSAVTNPSFTLTEASLDPHTIYHAYTPTVNLFVQSSLGCVASVNHDYHTVHRPAPNFNIFPKSEGCLPLTITLRDSSFTNSINPISSYTWCNGAPAPNTIFVSGTLSPPLQPTSSVIPNQLFTYTAVGTYSPYLVITTSLGCTETSYIGTVTVVNPPAFTYTLPPSPICANTPVTFTLAAIAPAAINHWHIQSDNGFFSDCTTDLNPTWKFTHPGVQNFTISAYDHSCVTNSIIPQTITVKGPVGKMRFRTNCTTPKTVRFNYNLLDVQNAQLSFGDGLSIPINGVVNGAFADSLDHTYLITGDYTATLTSNNLANGCAAYTQTMLISVRIPTASFVGTGVSCNLSYVSFTANASPENYVACGRGYTWFVDNVPPMQTATNVLTYSFSTVGNHTIKLLVKDVNGCTDEATNQHRISEPVPSFTFASNPVCFSNLPLTLVNTTSQTPDAVNSFTWSYIDNIGTPNQLITSNFGSTFTSSVTFNTLFYSASQTKTTTIKLIAKNEHSCTASVTQSLAVNRPYAQILTLQPSCFPGPPTQISLFSSPTYTNYMLYFGDGQSLSSTSAFTTHAYTTPGIFTPTLTVSDFGGCQDTYTNSTIEIQPIPVGTFSYVSNITQLTNTVYCLVAAQLGFTNNAVSAYSVNSTFPLQYIWDLGSGPITGPAGTTYTAGKTYTAAGIYTINITAQTSAANCYLTHSLVIAIYDPHADFDLDKDKYCLGSTITASINNVEGVHHLQWDFGDNQATNTFLPSQITTFYPYNYFPAATNGSATIILTASSPGNECKDVKTKNIQILRVLADYDRNEELTLKDYANCLGTQELFNNKSSTNSTTQLDFNWNLGTGFTSTLTDVIYTYPSAGVYTVNLHASDPVYGCEGSVVKSMTIFPLPTASIEVSPNACPDVPFIIKGAGTPGLSGNLTGTLAPTNLAVNFNSQNSFSMTATAAVSSTYALKVTDENGCNNKLVFDSIFIQQPAPPIQWDTTVVIGQPIPLNAYVGNNYTYTWTPVVSYLNCDTCYLPNPISSTTIDITYSVAIQDTMFCATRSNKYTVHIDIITSIDVPTAFTPNGDGTNDIIYPDGWGIKKLLYFKIYNRWGQLLFESNDIKVGWNGIFNGVPQNMETYVYQVSVETYKNEVLSKSGTIKLIR